VKRLFAVLALAGITACAKPALPPVDPTDGRAAVTLMSFGTQSAELQCTANARHLARFDEDLSEVLFDRCVNDLIPARDALIFSLPQVDPWTPKSQAALGCAAKAVRVSIERVRSSFIEFGYGGQLPATMNDAFELGRRFEGYATESCDPLHPTSSTTTYVDPHIANVTPEYPQ
jgi:hypothetical protein